MPDWYRTWWVALWGAITVTGAWVGVVSLGVSVVTAVFIIAAAIAALTSIVVHGRRENRTPTQGTDVGRLIATHGVLGGMIGAAVVGLGATSPGVTWLLVLLAATTSPWTTDLVSRWRGGGRPGSLAAVRDPVGDHLPDPPGPSLVHADCRLLDDRALCRRWRATFFDLQEAATTLERARIVARRADYLEELERRDPTAMSSWLATEPRAASGPEKFLHGADDPRREAS